MSFCRERNLSRRIGVSLAMIMATFLSGFFFNLAGLSPRITNAVEIAPGYDVNFLNVLYDTPTSEQSTWFYSVTSSTSPAISHVTLALSLECLTILDAGTWDGLGYDSRTSLMNTIDSIEIGSDPTTSITGLKFNIGFDNSQTLYYYFTVGANYTEGDMEVAIFAGNNTFKGNVTGPNAICTPTSVDLTDTLLTASPMSVLVQWETFDESNISHFVLYRVEQGQRIQLAEIVAESIGAFGGSFYTFEDTGLEMDAWYEYQLDMVTPEGTIQTVDLGRVFTSGFRVFMPMLAR